MDGYSIKRDVKDVINKKFNFDIQNLDFCKSESCALFINRFVEQQTKNTIKNFIAPDKLDRSTRLVAVNAICLKADWKQKFHKEDSFRKDFYINETQSIQVNYMNKTGYFMFAFLEDLHAKVLELKYETDAYSFFIVLPNKRTDLLALESDLRNYDFKQIINKLDERCTIVTIPKFKIEFESNLDEVLKKVCCM